MKLSTKQISIINYFVDTAQAAPQKINQLCRLTLSSKLNTGEDFNKIIISFMDCNPAQVRERCAEVLKNIY